METPVITKKKVKKKYPKLTEVKCGRCSTKNYYVSYLRTKDSECTGCKTPM